MYLWRAVDAEGEVLEVLVQAHRDKRAAAKLMRKLLKRQGLGPIEWVTDKYPAYGAALRDLQLKARHIRASRRITGPKARTSRSDDENGSCRALSRRARRNDFSPCTLRPTTPSTSAATSSPLERTASFEPRRSWHGV